MAKKREKIEKQILKDREVVVELTMSHSSSSWLHDGVGLACVRDHARAPAKSSQSGVYDSGGTSYLPCSCGSCVPCPGGGIRRGMLGILRMRVWCTPASIPLLAAAVLWLGAASFDSFGEHAYCGLHKLVRDLHGD
jgi:hypothetical protein